MKHLLAVPYIDARAADLSWQWQTHHSGEDQSGSDAPPSLATLRVPTEHGTIHLSVLGSSHRVKVSGLGTETIACGVPGTALPRQVEQDTDAGIYRLWAEVVDEPDHRALTQLVAGLDHRADRDSQQMLLGRFGCDPLAVTALLVEREPTGSASGVLRWHTWHVYPQADQIVRTISTWVPRP
ncbi:MAG: DUF2617 family protein [Euzebya sp.]